MTSEGICILEVLGKMVVGILNLRLMAAIKFHTGTASLETNILKQLMAMRKGVLYWIFLCMHKAYHALDHGRCLDILAA